MRELLSEHYSLFEKGCDFVALFFLDNETKITACLCSQSSHDNVDYSLNEGVQSAQVYHRFAKNVAGRDYYFNLFRLEVAGKCAFSFGELPLVTAYQFPLSSSLCSYAFAGELVAYVNGSCLRFDVPTRELLKELQKKHKRALRSALKSEGIATRLKVCFMRTLHTLLRPFFKKEIWLVADRCESAGDNGQAFFEYLCANIQKNIKPYFVINKGSADYKEMKKIGKVVSPRTLKFKLFTTFATRVIASQLEYDIVNPFSFDKYLKDILAKRKIVFLQHGITKDDISSTYNRYARKIDLFVTASPAEHASIVNNDSYGFDEDIVKLTGFARYDKLISDTEKIIFIAPTWRKYCLKSTDSAELIDGFEESQFYNFYSQLLKSQELIDTAKRTGYSLCFYPHFLLRSCKWHLDTSNPVYVNGENYTYNDVFKKGSLLLTDYSSVQFDFAYLRKPIIYCQFDKDEFFASHNYVPGYFNYEEHGFGPVTRTVTDTVKCLCEYMENGCVISEKYKERAIVTFKYIDKENCKRILEEVLK